MRLRPLFVTGIARSGTSLLTRMLSAHSQIEMAVDAFLPVYRSIRDAIACNAGLQVRGGPLEDTYFNDDSIKLLDRIEASNLDIRLDAAEWPGVREQLLSRASDHASDLCPSLSQLVSIPSFHELFLELLNIVSNVRMVDPNGWVGAKDVWTIDFMAPLARSFPDACFIVIIRDPRACVASNDAAKGTDQFGHNISYARHWRKNVVRALHYQTLPIFSNRFALIRYEDLVQSPEPTAIALTQLLKLNFEPQMLNPESYYDHTTRETWKGNSSFESPTVIDDRPINRWRHTLDDATTKTVEFLCGPEMQMMHYDLDDWSSIGRAQTGVLEYFLDSNSDEVSWRSDTSDPMRDFGYELFRGALFTSPSPCTDVNLIRRCFLSDIIYRRMRESLSQIQQDRRV